VILESEVLERVHGLFGSANGSGLWDEAMSFELQGHQKQQMTMVRQALEQNDRRRRCKKNARAATKTTGGVVGIAAIGRPLFSRESRIITIFAAKRPDAPFYETSDRPLYSKVQIEVRA
jgi:hypothetical protein